MPVTCIVFGTAVPWYGMRDGPRVRTACRDLPCRKRLGFILLMEESSSMAACEPTRSATLLMVHEKDRANPAGGNTRRNIIEAKCLLK
jgi:hypothetical protein